MQWIGPVLLALVFLVLKLWAVRPVIGDEGIYFYLGQRAAAGLVPYRDFVFSHPPLHIYALGLLSWIGGGSFGLLKLAPSLYTLASGALLFLVARREPLLRPGGSPHWALVPPLVFLLCYDTLRASSHATGVNQALMLLLAGLLAHVGGRSRVAGTAFGASLATATYVLPVIGLIGLVSFPLRKRSQTPIELRRFGELAAWGAASFALIHLPVWILAPGAWWNQTVRFHANKPAIGSTFEAAFRQMMTAEGFLVVASALFLVWWLLHGRPGWQLALPGVGLGYVVFLSLFERVYIYYLLLALPFLALGGGLFLEQLWQVVREGPTRRRYAGLTILLLALIVQPWLYRRIPDVARDPGAVRRYTFEATPGMGPINIVVGALFPERRVVGIPVPGVVRYLWHENTWWSDAPRLAAEIAELLPADGTLYGDSTTTPILAVLAGRRVACDLADTNTMWFRSGMRQVDDDLACAQGDGLQLIVVQNRRGIDRIDEFQRFYTTQTSSWQRSRSGSRRIELRWWQPGVSER